MAVGASRAEASFVLGSMFGTKVVYLDGRLALCFSARTEPWRGVLVCTEREHHASLKREFPALARIPCFPSGCIFPSPRTPLSGWPSAL